MTPDKVAIRTEIKNILFTTDFSVASKRAFPWAVALARQNRATVHAAHVVAPPFAYVDPQAGIDEDNTCLHLAEAAKHTLDNFLRDSPLDGVQFDPVVRQGNLWECLSRLIEERKIDLIIVGTKGSTGLARVMLGSGAEQIFREAHCPVMTIGPNVSLSARSEFKEVLFAMEFKETSMVAYPHAIAFAAQNHGCVTVLHVVTPSNIEFGDKGMPEYKELVRSLVFKELRQRAHHEKCPVDLKVVVECGSPPGIILRVARQLPSDLIVMSVHHARRLATHLPWAVAHEVVANAHCPVITIRS
jgi:nucleotide-binding universal stress UspA family protein